MSERNSKGQFKKGVSGNPGGRPKLPETFRDYAEKSPENLRAIADDPKTPARIRADIEKWFAEMYYGKAAQRIDMDGKLDTESCLRVKFEGKLEEWSV